MASQALTRQRRGPGSCRDGRRILWRTGYSGIEVRSCRGGFYRYTAWRNGKQFLMAVDARGDVSRLRRIY